MVFNSVLITDVDNKPWPYISQQSLIPTSSKHAETIVMHVGYRCDATTISVAVQIYQTTSYQFNSTECAGNLFALKKFGNGS